MHTILIAKQMFASYHFQNGLRQFERRLFVFVTLTALLTLLWCCIFLRFSLHRSPWFCMFSLFIALVHTNRVQRRAIITFVGALWISSSHGVLLHVLGP